MVCPVEVAGATRSICDIVVLAAQVVVPLVILVYPAVGPGRIAVALDAFVTMKPSPAGAAVA